MTDTRFESAEEAWFWTVRCLQARREGAKCRAGLGKVERPCDPDDVVKALDGLYQAKRISLQHGRVLRWWGECQTVPDATRNRADHLLWTEAMDALLPALRSRSIVG